ncbi:MAG TPA: hypothetical protein VGM17_15430 [Rhizomicrobium sp.]|jgi:hypothetical protein
MTGALDALLSAPLAEPADNGFSARVALTILDREERRAGWHVIFYAIAISAVLAVLPFTDFAPALMNVLSLLMHSQPVVVGLGVIALSLVGYRFLERSSLLT